MGKRHFDVREHAELVEPFKFTTSKGAEHKCLPFSSKMMEEMQALEDEEKKNPGKEEKDFEVSERKCLSRYTGKPVEEFKDLRHAEMTCIIQAITQDFKDPLGKEPESKHFGL